MNSKLIKILSVICVALILLIVLEWLYAARVQKQLLSTINSPSKQALPDMPKLQSELKLEEDYSDLVNRPLFIAGRKPVPETEQAQTDTTTSTHVFDWQLSGVYTTPKGLMALLTRSIAQTPADKYRKVIVGANIDGWKVAEIHPDKIILAQGSTQKNLLLRPAKTKNIQKQNGATSTNPQDGRTPPPPEPTSDFPENDNNAPNQ